MTGAAGSSSTRDSSAGPDPGQSEGDGSSSPRCAAWQSEHLDEPTRALLARDSAAFLHQSVSTPCPSAIRKAEGLYIEDMAGRRYMDFHGNNVHHLGRAHPHVIAAIKAQLDELAFAPRRFASERAVELAEALSARFRSLTGQPGRVLFTTGGSDAVGVAIKLARATTGRFKILSFWDSFHGAGFGASSVGGESLFRSGAAVGPLLPGTEHVAPFGCYRCAYGHPVDAEGQPNLTQCRLACAAMVKALGGGVLPIAACVARDDLNKYVGAYAFGHYTHEKNPVTAAAALATLEVIERDGLVEHAARLGEHALARLCEMKARHAHIGDVRGSSHPRATGFGAQLPIRGQAG